MKKCTITIIAVFLVAHLFGQHTSKNLEELQPSEPYTNVHVQLIGEDSLTSAFVIWIKSHVPLHYHAFHSENVLVIAGHGLVRLGDETRSIQPGDHLFIPANTPHAVTVKSPEPLKVLSVQSPRFSGSDRILLE